MKFVLLSTSLLTSVFVALYAVPGFASEWQRLEAGYEVPVRKELAAYGNFEMKDLRKRVRGGLHEVRYTLPRELTGRAVEIHIQSDDGGKTFRGPLAQMDCRESEFDCKLRYPGLSLNEEEVKAQLQSMGIDGRELAARMEVHRFFAGGDIVGFIHIRHR